MARRRRRIVPKAITEEERAARAERFAAQHAAACALFDVRTQRFGDKRRLDAALCKAPIEALVSLPADATSGAPAEWRYGSAGSAEETTRRILASEPPEAALRELERARTALKPAVAKLRGHHGAAIRRRTFDVEGDEVDVDRWRNGYAECWTRARRKAAPVGVRLGVNFLISGGNGEEDFARLLGTMAGAVDVFQTCGLGVELVGLFHIWNGGSYSDAAQELCLTFPLSTPERPASSRRLAALAYPGFLRGFAFTWLRGPWGGCDSSLGNCMNVSDEMAAALKLDAIVDRSWGEDGQADRIVGLVERVVAARKR